jgi:heterodisulfide reductase subunit D
METKYLQEWENELNICIRCAYCYEGCPIFKQLGWEEDGARGKVILSYGLLSGEIEPSEYIAEKIFQCSFCRDCMERCSANVAVPDILAATRADLFEAGYLVNSGKQLLDKINHSGNIFNKELASPDFNGEKQVLLGCRLLERTGDAKRYLDLLEAIGAKPTTFDETCCGMPFAVLGDRKGFASQHDKFKESIPDTNEEIICACTTCACYIKKYYPELKMKYIVEEIVERLPQFRRKINPLNIRVTYHDPCNVSRVLNMVEEPRILLKEIGAELIEMSTYGKQSECCGGGGGLLVTDRTLADRLAEKRVKQAIETGADYLVTLCPTCELNLRTASERLNAKLQVKNVLDLIWDAMFTHEASGMSKTAKLWNKKNGKRKTA